MLNYETIDSPLSPLRADNMLSRQQREPVSQVTDCTQDRHIILLISLAPLGESAQVQVRRCEDTHDIVKGSNERPMRHLTVESKLGQEQDILFAVLDSQGSEDCKRLT